MLTKVNSFSIDTIVICHFVPHLIDFHNEKYETDLVVDTFHNYSFHKGFSIKNIKKI